jgi:RimJ/RimL family protein N-acetyltransferase
VIDRYYAGRGQGSAAIAAAISDMRSANPQLKAVRASHHLENVVAARLYAQLGFTTVGEKVDGETGMRDKLLELSLCPEQLRPG